MLWKARTVGVTGAFLGGRAFSFIAVGLVGIVLTVLVGIGYVWWSRSAGSAVVHYSWPIKWAITMAAESPDLPPGARFATARMSENPGPGRWTVRGQIELPNPEGPRLLTSYAATVSSTCPSLSKRQCWTLDRLVLGSVPAATAPDPHFARVDPAVSEPIQLAALPDEILSDAEQVIFEEATLLQDADLAYILEERIVSPTEDLFAVLGWSGARPAPPAASRADPGLVRSIQSGLTRLGYDPGPVDGIAGRKTIAAAADFREDNGLRGSVLDAALLEEIASRSKSASVEPAPAPGYPEVEFPKADTGVLRSWSCGNFSQKDRDCSP